MTTLQDSVYKQLAVDSLADFQQTLCDIRKNGAQAGFHGFIYYTDTYQFTRENLPFILNELREFAGGCGYETLTDCLFGFPCLRGLTKSEIEAGLMDDESDSRAQVYNAISWFALETVAIQLDEAYK